MLPVNIYSGGLNQEVSPVLVHAENPVHIDLRALDIRYSWVIGLIHGWDRWKIDELKVRRATSNETQYQNVPYSIDSCFTTTQPPPLPRSTVNRITQTNKLIDPKPSGE
jgi:hypothetical protein